MRFSSTIKIFLLLGLVSYALVLQRHSSAITPLSQWFIGRNPEFAVLSANVNDADYPPTVTQRGNIDCSNLTFTHRDGGLFSLVPRLYKESKISGCYVKTAVGAVDSNGFVSVNGTDYVAEMIDANNNATSYRAFPNTDIFISNSSASPAVGAYIWFDHLQSSLSFSKSLDGKMFAKIKPLNQAQLTDKSGTALPVMADNFGLSENGDWLVVDSPGRALIRVNLSTMEVLPFESSFEFGNGVGSALRYAISGDGRYVAVASKSYGYFRIFDLSTCEPAPNTITIPVTCQSRDLNTFTRTRISDMGGILQMRFSTDNLLRFYATYDVTSSPKTGRYVIAAPGTSLTGMDYLALGDSFSSGEGAQKYEIGTDERGLNLCHLSKASYPYVIANKLSFNSFHSVACSGATTLNLKGGSGFDKEAIKPDRDNQYEDKPLNNSLGNWIPGYDKQVRFVTQNSPHLITASAIGNDINFDQKLEACIKPGTCFPSYEDKQEVLNEIDSKLNVIIDMYTTIKKEAPLDARIYAVGYPQVAISNGSCGLNVHMNQQELTFASNIITRLNTVIKIAAAKAGVFYVDIENALNGYRLCESSASNIAVNGLTAGKDIFGIIGNESYHPNEFGQFLMAQKILGFTNNLSLLNPASIPSTSIQKLAENDPVFTGSPKTNRTFNKLLYFKPATDITYHGQTLTATLNAINYALPPSSTYQLNLDETAAGTATTDTAGNLTVNLPISSATETGLHTLHIYGEDITNQPLDISAVVTIASSPSDFNGNGIPNSKEPCAPVSPSNIDIDKDGIDDACDMVIGPAPATPTSPNIQLGGADTGTQSPPPTIRQDTSAAVKTASFIPGEVDNRPKNFVQAVGTVLGSTTNVSKEKLNPAPVIISTKEVLKEKASLHPKQFLALLIILIFVLTLILMLHEEELLRTPTYTAYN